MNKATIIVAVMCAMILVSVSKIPTSKASIGNFNWTGTIVRNSYDDFYGASVTGYEEGTTANLVVGVFDDYSFAGQINVSAVKVGFDWGINYSSSECSVDNPFVITALQYHVFNLNFTVPSVLVASNLVTHSYTIYVEHVNSTSGGKKVVSSWTMSGTGFAVFSSDQADAYNFKQDVNAYPSSLVANIPLLTAKARQLMLESNVAKSLGSSAYARGDFSTAKAQYNMSLNFIQQAWSNETDKWSTFEDSLVDILKGGGTLLTFQGYAWILFGIGFILMSIGALVYLIRKKPQPMTS
jgi:hypothetical protein